MSNRIGILFLLIYICCIISTEALKCWENEEISTLKNNITVYGSPVKNNITVYGSPELKECVKDHKICFSTWRRTENGTFSTLRVGCFDTQNITANCVYRDKCVANGSISARNDLFYCCCAMDECNLNFGLIPTTTPSPTTTNTTTVVSVVPLSLESNKGEIEEKVSFYLVYVLFPTSMLLLLIIMYLLKRRKNYFSPLRDRDQHSHSLPSTPSNDKLRHVKLEEEIARGKFGPIRKATYKNELVAVKIMPAQEKTPWLTEQEVFKSQHMNHENILRFIAAEKRGTEFWILTAYHPMGSLYNYLKTHTITWEQFLHLGFTTARGLTHLHEEIMPIRGNDYKPAIAHRDFKSSNILLKNDLTACIADFDLALIFNPNRSCGDVHGQVGTRRYMAPEVLEGAINFSCDSFLRIDTYAFGLVLWELASRCSSFYPDSVPPYKLPFEAEVGIHPSLEDMQEIVVQQKRRPIIKQTWYSHSGFVALCSCIEECWDHDPEARISASCVMERFLDQMNISDSSTTSLLYNIATTDATDSITITIELANGYQAV